jgi:glycerophosphoryl diester phosphodiesterase
MSSPASQDRPLIIAHRGARSLAPENTIAAGRKALEVGADMWELDVGMTADGELLVVHDDTLTRTSNVKRVFPERRPWSLAEFTLEEIRRLDFGTWFAEQDPFDQIAAGAVSPIEIESYVGEPAPTLRQALVFTRDHDWHVNVEIKDLRHTPGDSQVVPGVLALLEELGLVDRVLVSSFKHAYLREIGRRNPRIATGALVDKAHADPNSLLRRLGARAYHPSLTAFRREQVSGLQAHGFRVNVWTVNDPEVMKSLMNAGVNGIFTDFPQILTPLVTEFG